MDAQPAESKKTESEYILDLNLFGNVQSGDCCDGEQHSGSCPGLERVIAALDHNQFLLKQQGDDAQSAMTAFCDSVYSKEVILADYIHFVLHHADPQSIEYIRNRLHFECESAAKCGATTRHYHGRRRDDSVGAKGMEYHSGIDRLDSIHFVVHHLNELGLRVSAEAMESELVPDDEEKDEAHLTDLALKRMAAVIESKRTLFSNQRLDGVTNSKFTLQIDEQKESGHGVGGDGLWSLYLLSTWC